MDGACHTPPKGTKQRLTEVVVTTADGGSTLRHLLGLVALVTAAVVALTPTGVNVDPGDSA
jgi:hypothetical protein